MPFRILSLDGGGIRGVVSATMLAEIEKQINQPLNQYFNLIAGTSTGAILAAAIASGKSSQEIVKLYQQEAIRIFPYSNNFLLKHIALLSRYGFAAPKFADTGLVQVLQEAFGDAKLFDMTSPLLLLTSYDTISRQPIIFKSWRKDKPYGNVPLWEACVCSASAPIFFPAHQLDRSARGITQSADFNTITLAEDASITDNDYQNLEIAIAQSASSLQDIATNTGSQTRTIIEYEGATRIATVDPPWKPIPHTSTYSITGIYSAIDGGVAANNPSSCAVAEALRLGYPLAEISVLSVGTGDQTRVIPLQSARRWGLLQWSTRLFGVLFDAQSGIDNYITSQVIHNRFLRLQFKLDRKLTGKRLSDDMDDVSVRNISNLIEAARVYVHQPQVQEGLKKFFRC